MMLAKGSIMFLRRVAIAAGTVLVVVFAIEGEVRAETNDDQPPVDHPAAPPRWSIGVNPLAMAIGRFGGDGEYLAMRHLALVGNVHGDFAASRAIAVDYGATMVGFGGEAGVRFYATPDLFGFFFGVSAVAGWYDVGYYGARFALPDAGFAVDLGGKLRLGGEIFMMIGGGLQDLWTTRYPKDIASGVSFVLGAGVAPRLLMTIGTAIY